MGEIIKNSSFAHYQRLNEGQDRKLSLCFKHSFITPSPHHPISPSAQSYGGDYHPENQLGDRFRLFYSTIELLQLQKTVPKLISASGSCKYGLECRAEIARR
jgi:hypothetical protein